jgi:hypothetical protein
MASTLCSPSSTLYSGAKGGLPEIYGLGVMREVLGL